MDLTEKYRVMLRAAPEIQAEWKLSPGDYLQRASFVGVYSGSQYAYTPDTGMNMEQIFIPTHDWDIIRPQYLWLPRQDQLQDMLKNAGIVSFSNKLFDLEFEFSNFIMEFRSLYLSKFETMEQLWLAFVMYEKYNKKWNGEEWI